MDKRLPIKVFKKRNRDELLTEAGGNKTTPKWVLKKEELSQRSNHLSSCVDSIAKEFRERRCDTSLPMIITTTISSSALAKSHRGEVVDLLNSDSNLNVIGIDSSDIRLPEAEGQQKLDIEIDDYGDKVTEKRRILSLVTTDELIENIGKALANMQNAKLISSIEDMKPLEAEVVDFNPQNSAYRVRLADYGNRQRNLLAQSLFKNKCAMHGISIERETRYTSDLRLYRVCLTSVDELDIVRHFDGVFSIEEAKPIIANTDCLDSVETPKVKHPIDTEAYPIIGVLDSGISRNAYLSPWLLDENEEYYGVELQDKSHGTMVASILEYSDELNGTDYNAIDGVRLFEAVVIPNQKKEHVYPEDIIDNVRDAIERHRDIKIWSMSLGTSEEIAVNSFSEYGMALDNIADENNVLIIKSVGNSMAFQSRRAPERIARMADSVRALVVGSIAHEKGKYDYADIDMPSPFSRRGPGPAFIIKPDLVAYGGNSGVLPNGNISQTGVKVLNNEGILASAAGTSFSTPWIARIASELDFLLGGEFDPLLIKALLIHSAFYPAGDRMTRDDKKNGMGFGMPAGTKDILHNTENEISLVLRDSIDKGHFIDILEFPFPQSLIGDDGLYHGQIILTMVSNPILRPSDGPEYCQSDIRVSFGTMDGIKERDTNKRSIRNPFGAYDAENIIKDSLYRKDCLRGFSNEHFGQERTLLQYGRKFAPIKKYAVDLDEMKEPYREKYLGSNRKWYLKIEPLFRDASEREAKANASNLAQDFCLLVTIKDPLGKAPVYTEVTQMLEAGSFVYSDLNLKNEIREHIEIIGKEDA